MRIQNRSKYSTAEVRELIDQATKGVNLTGVTIMVNNCNWAHSGRAYLGVPRSLVSRGVVADDSDYLIKIWIGDDAHFPVNNMRMMTRYSPKNLSEAEALAWAERTAIRLKGHLYKVNTGIGLRYPNIRYQVAFECPYGGAGSPLITVNNWREGMVVIAAHEARHIHQYRHGKPASEVDCERFAAEALDRYRAEAAAVE